MAICFDTGLEIGTVLGAIILIALGIGKLITYLEHQHHKK